MADNKKSILEEALLDAKKIQAALDANTKEILRSVAREEIDGLVKESLLREDDFETEDVIDGEETDVADEFGGGEEDSSADEFGGDGFGAEPEGDMSAEDDITGTDEVDPMGQESGMDADAFGGETEMDMTAASDDDVIAIYKKLSGDDEIQIVGDDIHLSVTEPGEYVIKGAGQGATEVGADMTDDMGEMDAEMDDMGDEELEEIPDGDEADSDDSEFEISLDDEDGEGVDDAEADTESDDEPAMPEDSPAEDEDEEEIDEQISQNHVAANRAGGHATSITGPGARGIDEAQAKYKALLTEATTLKAENQQFREALKKFRGMLIETVVLNANLSYVAKLISEHSTTKEEKKNIITRFDSEVSTLVESKKLYKTIANELTSRKPLAESIERKIIKEGATSTSQKLNETTAYADPSTARIMDLIKRVENKNNQ